MCGHFYGCFKQSEDICLCLQICDALCSDGAAVHYSDDNMIPWNIARLLVMDHHDWHSCSTAVRWSMWLTESMFRNGPGNRSVVAFMAPRNQNSLETPTPPAVCTTCTQRRQGYFLYCDIYISLLVIVLSQMKERAELSAVLYSSTCLDGGEGVGA